MRASAYLHKSACHGRLPTACAGGGARTTTRLPLTFSCKASYDGRPRLSKPSVRAFPQVSTSCLCAKPNRQHQLAYCRFRSPAHGYLCPVTGLRPLRCRAGGRMQPQSRRSHRCYVAAVADLSTGLIATMSRSDFSPRTPTLTSRLSRAASRSTPSGTRRDLPRSRTFPFRPCRWHLPDRLSCRASGSAAPSPACPAVSRLLALRPGLCRRPFTVGLTACGCL